MVRSAGGGLGGMNGEYKHLGGATKEEERMGGVVRREGRGGMDGWMAYRGELADIYLRENIHISA